MPSSYTPSLRLVLPVTGELQGAWGDTVNTGLTNLVDAAIAGTADIAMTDANRTLSVNNELPDEARCMFINLTGTLTVSRDVICPAVSKLYFVHNATNQVVVFKTLLGTGVSIPVGSRIALYCNATNVVPAVDDLPAASKVAGIEIVTVSGTQTLTNKTINLTSNTLVATSAQIAAAVTDETGTGALVFAGSPALTGTPTTPTAAAGTNTTQVASTAHVFAERSNTATLTNKTISGSNNTLSNIGNASLTNSSITFGSTAQALGSTVSALNGVSIGATTANTGAFTDLSYTGTLTGGTGVINIGSGQLVKDASGNVGIGTSSPRSTGGLATSQLSIEKAGFAAIQMFGNANNEDGGYVGLWKARGGVVGGTTNVQNNDIFGGTYFGGWADGGFRTGALILAEVDGSTISSTSMPGRIRFATAASGSVSPTEHMRITSAGNVGIGTSSPATFLHLNGANTAFRGQLVVQGPSNTFSGLSFYKGTTAQTDATLNLYSDNSTNEVSLQAGQSTGFFTVRTGGTTERMRIDSAGNVGIGTNSPIGLLDVNGTGFFRSGSVVTGTRTNSITGGALEFSASSTESVIQAFNRPSFPAYNLRFNTQTNIQFDTASTERMRITSAGNVGIGTTAPAVRLELQSGGVSATNTLLASMFAGSTNSFIGYTSNGTTHTGGIFGVANNLPALFYIGGSERMRITSAGNVGIGTTAPAALLHLGGFSGTVDGTKGVRLTNNVGTVALFEVGGSGDSYIGTSSNSDFNIRTNNLQRMRIGAGGEIHFPGVGTTASAANAFLNSASSPANQLLRSTSSIRYKTDVETVETPFADKVLELRPVWYRSKAEADKKDWSWYGLIAEEVAEVEPRLVHWSYPESAYEEVSIESEGEEAKTERKLKEDAELVPDGVQYERLSVLLLDVVKRQQEAINDLKARLDAANL
jgi:hypothetical protein